MSVVMPCCSLFTILCRTMAAIAFLFAAMAALMWIKQLKRTPGFLAGLPFSS